MKQIWPNYSYSPTTNVLTLTGLNIDRDQLLLVTAADRGRIMYNFADSSVTASAFTSGANTALTLVATTAGLTTTAALVIYYDDQLASNSVTVSSLPAISGTVTVNSSANFDVRVTQGGDPVDDDNPFPIDGTVTIGSLPAISGTVTANLGNVAGTLFSGAGDPPDQAVRIAWTSDDALRGAGLDAGGEPLPIQIYLGNSVGNRVTTANPLPISGTVTIGSALPAGTNRIGVVTIGGGTVTIGAGTSQIGSVTASISNSVVTFYPLQGTAVSNTNFTSTTASTTLVSAVAGREVLTVFNEGAGNLHISPGATCTTIAYQVRLSAGDYWECPAGQLSLAHTAVFATAGTARVTEVS